MKVLFLKDGIYRGKNYKKNSVIEMSEIDVKAYLECRVVKFYIPVKKKSIKDFSKMSYRDLQDLCKSKNIPAIGSKEKLISSLNGKSG